MGQPWCLAQEMVPEEGGLGCAHMESSPFTLSQIQSGSWSVEGNRGGPGWEVGALGSCPASETNLLCGLGGHLGHSLFTCLRRCEIMALLLLWSFLEYAWIDSSRKHCWTERLT